MQLNMRVSTSTNLFGIVSSSDNASFGDGVCRSQLPNHTRHFNSTIHHQIVVIAFDYNSLKRVWVNTYKIF